MIDDKYLYQTIQNVLPDFDAGNVLTVYNIISRQESWRIADIENVAERIRKYDLEYGM